MNIRTATINDLEAIMELNGKAFADNIKWDKDTVDYSTNEVGIKYYEKALQDPEGCFLVCEDDGALIGYANGQDKKDEDRKSRYFELSTIGVSPDRRGEKIGKSLLDEITKWAKEKQFDKIYLNCYVKNKGALEFYRKNGYQEIDVSLEREI